MTHSGSAEHRALAEAIKSRNLAAAQEVMSTHLDRTARRVHQGQGSAH